MSIDSEKMKALVTFKKKLEKRLEKLDAETKELQTTLETVNSILLEKGFKRGDIKEAAPASMTKEVILPKQEPETQKEAPPSIQTSTAQPSERESVIPLKAMNDEPLAIMYFENQSIHVMPDETKKFNVNTPPFGNFLVERVFAKMQEKDAELVRLGQMPKEKIFSYNIVKEEDLIREIIIKNFDDERLKELKSSIRWTLEKMYEKMKS